MSNRTGGEEQVGLLATASNDNSGGGGGALPRRKASTRPHRFSVDYYGFPRINDDSDDSNSGGDGTPGGINSSNNNKRSMSSAAQNSLDQMRGNRALQFLATFAANMGAFAFGTALSYPAVALPSLREDIIFKQIMTLKDESWIGSVFALGAVVSGPVAGFAIERLGRRMSMLVLSVPFFLSWMLINIATDIPMILIGRFLTGFFSGVFLVAAPIFTAEIADVSIRGAVGATFDMSSSVGILFIYIIGSYCTWRTQAFICAIVPILIFLLMLFVPESPAYLLEKGNTDMAKDSLLKYKGAKNNPQVILAALDDLQQEIIDTKASESASFRDLLARPVLVPVSIAFMVFLFQVICGLDPILIYTVDIFKSAGAGALDEYSSTVIFGVIELVAGILAAFFVDKTGRRFLLLLSEAVMVLSLASLGVFFYLRGPNTPLPATPDIPATETGSIIGWLPLTSLSIYILAYSIGLGPVGYLLMGEILPLRVKGLAGCLLTSAKWMLSFIVTYFFEDVIGLIGESGCYWLFSGLCAVGFVYILFFVPETSNRSLEDIQRNFRRRFSVEDVRRVGDSDTTPLLRHHSSHSTSSNKGGTDGDEESRGASSSTSSVPIAASYGYQSINA